MNAERRILHTIFIVLSFSLIACSGGNRVQKVPYSSSGIEMPEVFVPWDTTVENTIAPGFEIQIASTADEQVAGVFRVNKEGTLRLPYRVEVHAAGLTLTELRRNLNKAYAKYLVNPRIEASIISREYLVEVGGLVNKPGEYLVEQDTSLEQVFAEAGGLALGTDQSPRARFVRITQGRISNLVRLQDYYSGTKGLTPTWKGGETVFPQLTREYQAGTGTGFVRLLGKIQTPGEYRFQPGKDIYDYLILAGGPVDQADLDEVTLIRKTTSGKETVQFSLKDASTFPQLQEGDALLFQPESASRLEKDSRVWGAFSGVVSALAGMAAMIGVAF